MLLFQQQRRTPSTDIATTETEATLPQWQAKVMALSLLWALRAPGKATFSTD